MMQLLASPFQGQVSGRQVPHQNWATAPPVQPDPVSSFSVDHQAMSPDSWSAPITGPAPILQNQGNAGRPNSFGPINPPGNQFDPNEFAPPKSPVVKNYRQLDLVPPSIPELQATIMGRDENSLIREPAKTNIPASLAGRGAQGDASPFQSTNFRPSGIGAARKGAKTPMSSHQTELGRTETMPKLTSEIVGGADERNLQSSQSFPETGPLDLNEPSVLELSAPRGVESEPVQSELNPYLSNRQLSSPSLGVKRSDVFVEPLPGIDIVPVPSPSSVQGVPGGQWGTPFAGAPVQNGWAESSFSVLPSYRPDLGHRMSGPTFRGRDHDSGQTFDFEEKKKDYPPFSEILATGRYFGSASVLFLQPIFQQNSAVTSFNSPAATATFANTEAFDFDYETAPRIRFGFESKYGPGIELDYWQFDQGSNVSAFTSNGTTAGELSTWILGPGQATTLTAINAGETISAIHSIDVEAFSAMFFKEVQFPISRMNGMFGFQYVSIFQTLDAQLTDAGGGLLGELKSNSDLRAYGPRFKFEYYRPIGHTKLEFVTSFGGGALFGERDQFVTNTQTNIATRLVGADEYVLTSDFYSGIQFKKMFAEKRGVFGRLGFNYQSWIGGGTAVDAQDDFGLRGFVFEVGYNR